MWFQNAAQRFQKWWIPIRVKITSPYLFLAIILAIGTGYIATQLIFDSLEERYTNQLIEAGKLASESMVKGEKQMLNTLRLLANTVGVPDEIYSNNPEQLRELTFGTTIGEQEDAVEFLDSEGNQILSMRHIPGGNLEEYQFQTGGGQIFSEANFVNQVLENKTDSYGDKFSGYYQGEWGDYFYIAGPVYTDEDEFVGVVLVGKSLRELAIQIRQETLAQITFFTPEGNVLTSTFGEPLDLPPGVAEKVISEQDQRATVRDPDSRREINVSNIDYDELLGPWEVRNDVDLGVLGSALPKNFLVSTSNVTRVQVSLFVAGTIAVIILVGLFLGTYITRPITHLVTASSKVAEGDLEVQIEPESNDEISVLTESFNQMVTKLKGAREDLLSTYDETLMGWSKALELRDKETHGHTDRVTRMTLALAQSFDMSEEELSNVRRGAILHDIGKMGVPDAILHKTDRLTQEEMEIIKKHPVMASEMIKGIDFLTPAIDIPYYHHERWDGSGYPEGLKGEEIPLPARIFSVIDYWDALRSERPYKDQLSIQESANLLKENSGTYFDPMVVERFFELYPHFEDGVDEPKS
jgi:putative nucleotidyltransferase with HDIG domain